MADYLSGMEDDITINASFDSWCPGCGEEIEEGDMITLIEGEWVCQTCL